MNPTRRPEQSEKPYLAHVRQNAHGSFLIHELEEQVRPMVAIVEGVPH